MRKKGSIQVEKKAEKNKRSLSSENVNELSIAKLKINNTTYLQDTNNNNKFILTPKGYSIDKKELIHVLALSLKDLGFNIIAKKLEKETNFNLNDQRKMMLTNIILQGEWDKIEIFFKKLDFDNEKDKNKALFLIYKQIFLEHIENNKTIEAIRILSTKINPLITFTNKPISSIDFISLKTETHKNKSNYLNILKCPKDNDEEMNMQSLSTLAKCLLFEKDKPSLYNYIEWYGYKGKSRENLLNKLNTLIKFKFTKDQLLQLIDQAIQFQIQSCLNHHNTGKLFSLSTSHKCDYDSKHFCTLDVLSNHNDEVWCLEFSHDGNFLASSSKDKSILIWDFKDYKKNVKKTLIKKEISKNNKNKNCEEEDAYKSNNDCGITIISNFTGIEEPINLLRWSGNDKYLLSCSSSMIHIWNIETGLYIKKISNLIEPACCWLHNSENFIGTCFDKGIGIYNKEGTIIAGIPNKHEIRQLEMSKDGSRVVCITTHCEIGAAKTQTFDFEMKSVDRQISSFTLSNDNFGRYALLNIVNPGEILLYDTFPPFSLLKRFSGHKQLRYIIHSTFALGNGNPPAIFCSGSEDSRVYIWHIKKESPIRILKGHSATINSVCWSPVDPHLFASASDDSTIRIWGLDCTK